MSLIAVAMIGLLLGYVIIVLAYRHGFEAGRERQRQVTAQAFREMRFSVGYVAKVDDNGRQHSVRPTGVSIVPPPGGIVIPWWTC